MNAIEFLKYVQWPNQDYIDYFSWLKNKYGQAAHVKILMKFRRDLQKGLSEYSKGKSGLDYIQMRALAIMKRIELWCSHDYKEWARSSILKSMPQTAKNPRKLKNAVNHAWETYVRKESY